MQSLAPSSTVGIKSIIRTPSPLSDPHRFPFRYTAVKSVARRYDSAPNVTNSVVPSTNNFTSGGVRKNGTDWLNTEKSGGADNNNNHISVVNGHNILDLVPADKIPKPLTNSDYSPASKHGSSLRVAYQGVPGNYGEAAAGKAYPDCETIPCDRSEDAFHAVELWITDRAVLPVETSHGGSIHRNYDLLLRHRLHIVGELQLLFNPCLLALPGVRKEYINRVISHPQALAQCEQTLTEFGLNNVIRDAVADTAGAAEFVAANNLRDTAAIASARAAEIYKLNILADEIQDDSSNVTRFIILAREPIIPRNDRPFKTSIVFAQDKGTSVLYKVLAAFAFRNIRLTKIESRPNRNRPIRVVDDANIGTAKHFEYIYYVDFEASMADIRAQNALTEVQEFTSFLRVLGSYPMDTTPENLTE